MKDWQKASERVISAIEREVAPILQKACELTLERFPQAGYVGIREGMGSAWIEIDGLCFHQDSEDENLFHVTGYKHRKGGYRTMRAWRLRDLAAAMMECGEFLDEFHAGFPENHSGAQEASISAGKSGEPHDHGISSSGARIEQFSSRRDVMKREITLQVTVTVPAATGENEVETAINAALDEPPCDWGNWIVGQATIVDVKKIKRQLKEKS